MNFEIIHLLLQIKNYLKTHFKLLLHRLNIKSHTLFNKSDYLHFNQINFNIPF